MYWVSRNFHAESVWFFIDFFGDKRIASKCSIPFHWLIIDFFSDFSSYGSELRKRYTLRLLCMCLEECGILEIWMVWFHNYFSAIFRSSHKRYSIIKGVPRNYAKFTGKHLCQSLRPATLLKKRLWRRCFLANFAKFLTTSFLQNTSGRLLLHILKAVLKNFRSFLKFFQSISTSHSATFTSTRVFNKYMQQMKDTYFRPTTSW